MARPLKEINAGAAQRACAKPPASFVGVCPKCEARIRFQAIEPSRNGCAAGAKPSNSQAASGDRGLVFERALLDLRRQTEMELTRLLGPEAEHYLQAISRWLDQLKIPNPYAGGNR